MSTTAPQALRGKLVTVIGGSGFIGRYVVRRLAQMGATVRVAVRDVEAASFLRTAGEVGQVTPVVADVTRPESIKAAVDGAYGVVNLVGILYPSGRNSFEAAQARGAGVAAEAARDAGASVFVHMSAIGAHPKSKAKYAKTKAQGETNVLSAFPNATILRPSIVFGPEDGFFNLFAGMSVFAPVLPLIGGGKTLFQPVSVRDVAEAVAQAMTIPEAQGKTYELGGPQTYSFKELLDFILKTTGQSALLVPVPWTAAKIKAAFLQMLPVPPLTMDQVTLLKTDNVVAEDALNLSDLGITTPDCIETEVPTYMTRYMKRGFGKTQSV